MNPEHPVEKIIATGPYLNFFFDSSWIAEQTIEQIVREWDEYGKGKKKNETILIEWRQPNTHKEYHVWHLRNELLSEAICTLCEAWWYDVIRTSYKWDIWYHIAKWVWYYITYDNSPIPEWQISSRAAKIYVAASNKIKEDEATYKPQVDEIHKRIEDNDPDISHLVEKTRLWCLRDLNAINQELWSTIQREYLETEVEQPWINIVKELVNKWIPEIRESQWAIIADLEAYDLWVFVLLKSNGASLYSTKDIALAELKKEEFTFDKSLYIVATEQIHHFNQLFKTLELIGYEWAEDLKHLAYWFVELPDGKMSSRAWNIISYYQLRDLMVEEAERIVASRDLTEEKKQQIAKAIAFAAMKFSMLVIDTNKKIIFDIEKALRFDGETWPYLQYTTARCNALLQKWKDLEWSSIDRSLFSDEKSKLLLLHLWEFSQTIQQAAEKYQPYLVARYLLDLAQLFNSYYQSVRVFDEDDVIATNTRLMLIRAVHQVMSNWLGLLGIEVLEEM